MTRDVAQFGSVYALGACGCRFESCHSEKIITLEITVKKKSFLLKRMSKEIKIYKKKNSKGYSQK